MVASTMAYSMSGWYGAGVEKPNENIGFDPIAVSLEDAVPVPEECRQVTPRTSAVGDFSGKGRDHQTKMANMN